MEETNYKSISKYARSAVFAAYATALTLLSGCGGGGGGSSNPTPVDQAPSVVLSGLMRNDNDNLIHDIPRGSIARAYAIVADANNDVSSVKCTLEGNVLDMANYGDKYAVTIQIPLDAMQGDASGTVVATDSGGRQGAGIIDYKICANELDSDNEIRKALEAHRLAGRISSYDMGKTGEGRELYCADGTHVTVDAVVVRNDGSVAALRSQGSLDDLLTAAQKASLAGSNVTLYEKPAATSEEISTWASGLF